jgi:hypothetical protein
MKIAHRGQTVARRLVMNIVKMFLIPVFVNRHFTVDLQEVKAMSI